MGKDDYGWSQVIGRWSSYGLEPSCNGVWPSWQLMWWHDAGDIILDAVFLIPEAVIFTCPVVTRRCGGPKSNHVGSLNSVGSAVLAVALLSFLAEVKLASYCRFRSWWFSRNGALPLHVLHEVHKLQCWVLLLHADPSGITSSLTLHGKLKGWWVYILTKNWQQNKFYLSHRIHGAGIYAIMTGVYWW